MHDLSQKKKEKIPTPLHFSISDKERRDHLVKEVKIRVNSNRSCSLRDSKNFRKDEV